MKRYGFFGGSFNPPTYAHLEIVKLSLINIELDKVFFVPVGNNYKKPDMIEENLRYDMLKLICKGERNIEVEPLELNQDETLNTIQAFRKIQNKYKTSENYYIMGADNFVKLPTWDNAEELISNYKFIVFQRKGTELEELLNSNELVKEYIKNVKILNIEENIDCSSGIIRNIIKQGKKDIAKIYTKIEVVDYINENKLYN